jgi:hypothetical protein
MSRSKFLALTPLLPSSLLVAASFLLLAVIEHNTGRPITAAGTTFVNSNQALGGETGNGLALGDLDGDGDVDAFVANDYNAPEANQVWFNQGDGTFSSGQALGTADGNAVALGDLDGDGDLDAIVATLSPISAQVWLNQGGIQGGTEGIFAAGVALGASSAYGVALGDIDNDGDLDALVVGNSNQVWLNNGSATFTAGPVLPFLFSTSAALADLDGDTWLDAVIADSGSGTSNRVYWNDGNWVPGPGTFTPGMLLPTAGLINGLAVGHLDGDNLADIFLAGIGPDQIYWNEGSRNFSTAGPLPVNDSSWAVALADVEDDGLLDAVVGNISAEPNRLWHNQGGRVFTVTQEFGDETGNYWARGLGLADLTGDALPDLFEVTTAEDRVWFNQSGPVTSGPAWQVQTVEQRGRTGLGVSLALDAAGRPLISYLEYIARPDDDDYRLRITAWDGEVWDSHIEDTIVDTAEFMAESTSLALDSQGRPHIVYESSVLGAPLDERLRYAYWDGSQWQQQTVDANAEPSGFFSLALDDQDRPHISYHHGVTANDLNYAWWNGSQWQVQVVDAAGYVGEHNSLALDAANNPHIAYYDSTNQELKYASRSGGGPWQVTVVDGSPGTGEYASLALDSAGRPHIAYVTDGDLRYAYHDGLAWQLQTIPTGLSFLVGHTVLALDANDDPHFIWNDWPDGSVWYTRRDGPGWHSEMAATKPTVGLQDLAVDAGLRPHITFHHSAYGDLHYAVLDEPWRVQPLDSSGLIERPSLALPIGGYDQAPQFSYYKPSAGLLRHLAWEEAMWQLTGVDFINAAGAGPSLAIGDDSRPRVSYYDADTQQLRYATWNGTTWQSQVVDSVPGTGRFSNLLLQGSRPDIAYWDANVRRIRLASWNPTTATWQFTINLVGPPAGPGSGYLSAARLSNGDIAVSYFQAIPSASAGGGALRLATWDGQAWTDTFIAGGLDNSTPYNALAVDAVENEPAVAYFQPSTGQIIYAYRQGTAWQSQPAVSSVSGLTGLALQLALDSHRQPRIAYAAADALYLASGRDGSWRTEPVYEEAGLSLNGLSLGLGRRQFAAAGSSSGLVYAATLAGSSGPEPWILTPYDPISPFAGCFEFFFEGDPFQPPAAPFAPAGPGPLSDLEIFLAMTPLFQGTAAGQNYIDLYGQHFQEMTGIVLDDTGLLWDSFGTLQNFLPGLEALVSGRGDEVLVTQEMVDDALDIWQRLAAAGSPTLAATINNQLAQYNDLQDFVGLTFDEWAQAIGVNPPAENIYLPIIRK